MELPNGTDKAHVSSVYTYRLPDKNHMAEGGWAADNDFYGGAPHYFSAYKIYGEYFLEHHGLATRGTYPRFSVRPQTTSTFTWEWLVDGTEKYQKALSFTLGTPQASSERSTLDDTNYSNFYDLRKRSKTSGTWYDWKDLQLYWDYDPEYKLQKNSNTACSMVAG